MDDSLDPVEQDFIANVEEYIAEVQAAADEARNFAGHAEEAKVAADGMRDGALEAGAALGDVRDKAAEASHEVKNLGQSADEATAKLDLLGLSGASTFTSLGGLIGLIGGLVVLGAGVAPALLSAGAGIAAFGALALPALMQVKNGYTAVTQAQQALANATTAKQRAKALQDEARAWAGMPAPIRMVVTEIQNLKAQWQQLGQQFQVPVVQDLSQVIGIVSDLLPKIVPLATAGAAAVHTLLSALGTSIGSTGFAQFLQLLTNFVGPATQAIMHLAGALTGILGSAITTLMGESVPLIGFLTDLVKALGGPLVVALNFVINLLNGLLSAIDPLLPGLSKIATLLVTDIGTSFEALLPIIGQVVQLLGGVLIQVLTALEPVIANALTANSPFMYALGLLPGLLRAIMPAITAVASILSHPVFAQLAVDVLSAVVAGKALIALLGLLGPAFRLLGLSIEATPVGWIITAIAAIVFAFIELWTHSAAFRNFWIGLWRDIVAAAGPAIQFVREEIGVLTAWWNSHWTEIREVARIAWVVISTIVRAEMLVVVTVVKVALTLLLAAWRIAWGLIRDTVKLAWDLIAGVIRIAVTLITGIISVFLDLITGHWSKAWHDLWHMVGTVLGQIASLIGNFARDAWHLLYDAGRNIIGGLISGVRSMIGGVLSLISGLASQISGAFSGVLHMHSPSRVFWQHGVDTVMGWVLAVRAMIPHARAAMRELGGSIASGGIPGITAGTGGGSGGGRINVTVPLSVAFGAGTEALMHDARFLQYIQAVLQEAVLRYNVNNPSNGLAIPGGRL